MAMTEAQLHDVGSRMIRELAALQQRITQVKGEPASIDAALATMQSTYGGWAGEVNALALAKPLDAGVATLKAMRDTLVAEFSSARTEAQAIDAAVQGA